MKVRNSILGIFFRPNLPYALWKMYDIFPDAVAIFRLRRDGKIYVSHANRHFLAQTGFDLKTLRSNDVMTFVFGNIQASQQEVDEVSDKDWQGVRIFENKWLHGDGKTILEMKWTTVKVRKNYLCKAQINRP